MGEVLLLVSSVADKVCISMREKQQNIKGSNRRGKECIASPFIFQLSPVSTFPPFTA